MRISDWSSDVCSSDLGTLALSAQGVNAGVALDSVQVDATGAVEDLQLDATARGGVGALDLSGSTRKEGANWQGTLASLDLAPAKGATWHLQSPARSAQRGSNWKIGRAAGRERWCQYV